MQRKIPFLLLICGLSYAQEVIWVRNGDWNAAQFGSSMMSLGDQNGDGYSDWAVASTGNPFNGSPWDDKRDFFYGGNPPAQEPYMTFHARQGAVYYALSYARSIGDFDGDGIDDWVLAFWTGHPIDSLLLEFHRGGQGSDTTAVASMVTTSVFDGAMLADIGDHNGDGLDDFYYFTGEDDDRGLLFLGSPDWNLDADLINASEVRGSGITKTYPDWSGDINGDGYSDYMTSGFYDDTTYFYFGSPEPDTIPDIVTPTRYTSRANMQIDLNGDGATELIRGHQGTISVVLGGSNIAFDNPYNLTIPGCGEAIDFVKPAGDFNSDGIQDVVSLSMQCGGDWGMFAVHLGAHWPNLVPVLVGVGFWWWPFDDVELFFPLGLGDVDGDGIDDIAISCAGGRLASQRGRVVIVAGDTTFHVAARSHPEFIEQFAISCYPNPFNSTLSISLSIPLHQNVSVTLYDLLGREVDVIHRGRLEHATLSYTAPSSIASGIYFMRATTTQQAQVLKVALVK